MNPLERTVNLNPLNREITRTQNLVDGQCGDQNDG
jgi:hypothetical protein